MIDIVKRYQCDACLKEVCVHESDNIPSWTTSTEIGDLCPACSTAWDSYKASFITNMRKANKEDLVQ